ncbi:MAG: tetratricopeptide repeat protein, partial [Gemmatimonadales bacterium]
GDRIGLPDWVFAGAVVLLIIGLPIIVATALAQSASNPAAIEVQRPAAATQAPGDSPPSPPSEAVPTAGRWLTWRRAILGGVLAFALLGVATTGFMVMRVLGIGPVGSLVAAGVLEERERIILAPFENKTSDSLMAEVLTEAFRIDLAQSPIVTVAEPEWVADVLERMERDSDTHLDLALAREVAIREGLPVVIAGEVGALGSSYVVAAEIIAAETGEVIAGFRETAKGDDDLVDAVDELSKSVRERIGESFKTIRSSPPLVDVTTSSLDALRKFTQAERAIYTDGDDARGIQLLEEALALDSTFAAAWAELGTTLRNRGEQRARAAEATTKAYELRDRLPDKERYNTIGVYYLSVTRDREAAINAYRTLLELYPDDDDALHQLALLYGDLRNFSEAEELYRRSIEIDSSFAVTFQNLMGVQVAQGKYEAAESTLAGMRRATPGHFSIETSQYALTSSRGDYDAAESAIRRLRESRNESLLWRANTSSRLATLARTQGRLADAERHLRDALAVQEQRGLATEYLESVTGIAWLDVWFREQPQRGLQTIEMALDQYPLESLDPRDRPYLSLAWIHAWAGQPERSRAYLSQRETNLDQETLAAPNAFLDAVIGAIALAEGRPDEAIAGFRVWDREMACTICALPMLGWAYDAASEPDSVIAVFERYANTPWLLRVGVDSYHLGPVYSRLGSLYEARGDLQTAISYYAKLIELWKDADPVLQPRVESARRAIEALSTDR